MCIHTPKTPDQTVSPHSKRAALLSYLDRFRREEDGAILVFGVFVFLLILMIGGIGIDMMRVERDRTRLQYTLDRAVLAAADLDQELEPTAVVRDYFDKAGLGSYLSSVSVNEGLSFREVTASAVANVPTQFMHMGGIDTIRAPANSTAEESIGGVEISLVLDVSGSMNRNNRLPNLKVAARDFVDTMVENTEDGKLSISIVPYAAQVTLPENFLTEFNISGEHNYSHCVNFTSNDFNTTALNTNQALTQTLHFDPWTYYSDYDNNGVRDDDHNGLANGTLVARPICPSDARRRTMVLQKNANTLKNFISNLHGEGNTSIDVGMKWGTALLDPGVNPAITAMINDGDVSGDFAARPTPYNDSDTLKVVVLMTDGQNTSQYYIDEDFRDGASDVWYNEQENKYSIYNPSTGNYFWLHTWSWEDHAYGNQEAITYCSRYRRNGSCRRWTTIPPEPGEAVAVDYPRLWAHVAMERMVEQFYEPWMNDDTAWSRWYYDPREYVGSGTKNSRTKAICDAAKARNIIVFTIGFEAPSDGQAVLRDCASSIAHYFDVDGLEIADAFASIASSIRKLRLTQ
jgi:Flp pilus assembly protein TadG